jgi:hypothetical protein
MKNKIVFTGWVDNKPIDWFKQCFPYSDKKLQIKDYKVKVTIEKVKEKK